MMSERHLIIRYPRTYAAISAVLVVMVMLMVAWAINRNSEAELESRLLKELESYVATLEAGTVNSRAMGAVILFGQENQNAKQLALGKLPTDAPGVSSELDEMRMMYLADVVLMVNKQGAVIAYSSNGDQPGVGRDLSFRPYVQLALRGIPNVYPAVGVISTDRGIIIAAPVRASTNPGSAAIGVVVIKIGADKLDMLLQSWTGGMAVLLSPQGVVFAASREDWQFHGVGKIDADKVADIRRTRQFGSVFDRAQPQSLPFSLDTQTASIGGVRYIVRSHALDWDDPEGEWKLVFLAKREAWWTHWNVLGFATLAGLVAALGFFWIYSVKRNAALLESMNDTLSSEVSERKRAERALKELLQNLEEKDLAKTRFLAAAGHDLRQPLAAANLFIDALKMTAPSSNQDRIIQKLDQAMSTFNGLLDALLNVSKLDSGVIKPEYVTIDVAEIFTWLEQNFAPMASEKKLVCKLYFPLRETLAVRSDIGLVKSILMNLVANAIKYTSRGGILISVRRRGKDALFQIWDTGMGIPQEHSELIFDEFYQIDNPQRDRTRGLGLGLFIVKRALSLLGAEIRCRSQVGRGTVFEFRLPLTDVSVKAKQRTSLFPQENLYDSASVRGKRLVVVEDDELVAQALVSLLESMGGEVVRFHSAEDALRHAHIEHADYYISDYMLSGKLNGIQFLDQLRQKVGRPINAVLITGDTSPSFYIELVDSPWKVLHKPINMSDLMGSLRAMEP